MIFGQEVSPPLDSSTLEAARRKWDPIRERLNAARELAAQQRWKEARDFYLSAMREPAFDWESVNAGVDSPEWCLPMEIGITCLLAGDTSTHQRLSQEWFESLKEFPDPDMALFLSFACLIREMPPTEPIVVQARSWESRFPKDYEAAPLARLMVAYQAGDFREALAVAESAKGIKEPVARLAAQVFGAMTMAKVGRVEDGKRELHKAETDLAPYLARFTGDCWWDIGLCQLALGEAHRLFNDAPGK